MDITQDDVHTWYEVFGEEQPKRKSKSSWRNTEDWWAVWIGSFLFLCILPLSLTSNIQPIFPIWETLEESWKWENAVTVLGFYCISVTLLTLGHISQKPNDRPPVIIIISYLTMLFVLSLIGKFLGTNSYLHHIGMSDSVWCMIFGILYALIHALCHKELPAGIRYVGTTVFYMKTCCVLLVTSIIDLQRIGLRGLGVACVDTPIILIIAYMMGTRLMHIDADQAIILACGLSLGGTSAATAITTSINADEAKSTLAIAIMSLFTVPLIPFLSTIGTHILHTTGYGDRVCDNDIVGSWIGGTVDNTGATIAAATISGEDEIIRSATIVKMMQNSLIGVAVVIICMFWFQSSEPSDSCDIESPHDPAPDQPPRHLSLNNPTPPSSTRPSIIQTILDKFPRFLIGFITLSMIVSMMAYVDEVKGKIVVDYCFVVSEWFQCLGFIIIGIELVEMFRTMFDSSSILSKSIICMYVIGQSMDLIVTGLSSYMFFRVLS